MDTSIHALNWFEIPVDDFERARAFYSAIFAFDMPEHEMFGARMGFFPADFEKGGVGGTIKKEADAKPGSNGTVVYLNCKEGIDPVLSRIESAGGRIVVPKTSLENIGFIAILEDTEGNHVGLHAHS